MDARWAMWIGLVVVIGVLLALVVLPMLIGAPS